MPTESELLERIRGAIEAIPPSLRPSDAGVTLKEWGQIAFESEGSHARGKSSQMIGRLLDEGKLVRGVRWEQSKLDGRWLKKAVFRFVEE